MTPLLIIVKRDHKVGFIRAKEDPSPGEQFLHTALVSIILPVFDNPEPLSKEEVEAGPREGDQTLVLYLEGTEQLTCRADDDAREVGDRVMGAIDEALRMERV